MINVSRLALYFGMAFIATSTQANVIWTETFDSGISGQSVTEAPYTYTRSSGSLYIASDLHPGWIGNGLDASLTSAAPENQTGGWVTVNLQNVPTAGLVTLRLAAWSNTGSYGSIFWLNTAAGESLGVQAWDNCCLHNVWGVYARPTFTGRTVTDEWYTPSGAYRDVDVLVELFIDYDENQYWAKWTTSSQATESSKFSFNDKSAIESLIIYNDLRGSGGTDVDWIQIESSLPPVPEPSSIALLVCGLISVAWLRMRGDA